MNEGRTIGQLRLVRELGRGGMGIVYLAEHVVLRAPRVVKLLTPEWAAHPDSSGRFVNEAIAASSLDNDHIVKVFDCQQTPEGEWVIVMEYLDGAALSALMASTGGPMALGTIVQIIGQACYALHDAHEHDIVHRDVKPDNIFLIQKPGNDHFVKVLDFGIAKRGGSDVRTRTGSVMGTPTYMAPEQLHDSKDITRACDIYALGVIVWEMITGRRLWGDVTAPAAIFDLQKHSAPPDPRTIRPDLPAGLVGVVLRALAYNPIDRFETAQQLALELAHQAPGTEWSESGIDILRRYVEPILLIEAEAGTVGQPSRPPPALPPLLVPGVPAMARAPSDPTVRSGGGAALGALAAPNSVPIVSIPTMVSGVANPSASPSFPVGTPAGVPSVSDPAIAAPPYQTPLVARAPQPTPSRRTLLVIGVGATAVMIIVASILLVAGSGGDSRDDRPKPAPSFTPDAGAPRPIDAAPQAAVPPDAAPLVAPPIDAAPQVPTPVDAAPSRDRTPKRKVPRSKPDAGAGSERGTGRSLDPDDVIGN